ncbi:MAG: hypothetical protein AAFR21_18965, partial [Pseudomonadota bacterium]
QEEPREGAGSRGGQKLEPVAKTGWLSNGDAMRQTYSLTQKTMGKKWTGSAARVSRPIYEHSIYLDTQLYDELDGQRRYACPTLAAWWQLVRLGADREESGRLRVPSNTISAHNAKPLFARRTLSFLDPAFIQVEHAVRDILRQSFFPEDLLSIARGRKKSGIRFDIREAVSYVFVDPKTFLLP